MLRKLAFFVLLTVMLALPLWSLAQPTLPPPPQQLSLNEATPLDYNTTIEGTFDSGPTKHIYTFNGHKGDIVAVRLVTPNPYGLLLGIRNSLGGYLVNATPSESSFQPDSELLISPFELLNDDLYSITIENTNESGATYTLQFTGPDLISLPFGRPLDGALNPNKPLVYYSFIGKKGDIVSVTAHSQTFNAYISIVLFEEFSSPTSDYNGGGGVNALISPYRLTHDGRYIITVRSTDSHAAGTFLIRLDHIDAPMLHYGDTVTANITAESPYVYYRFAGVTGDIVSVRVDSGGSVDTVLTITDPSRYLIANDDDGANGFDPEINNIVLAQNTEYFIRIRPYSADVGGQITLTLNKAAQLSLDNGLQEVRLNDKAYEKVIVFTGIAGEHVRIHFEVSNVVANPSMAISQNGLAIASLNLMGLPGFTADVVIPEDGIVQIQINSAVDVRIRLSLERISS